MSNKGFLGWSIAKINGKQGVPWVVYRRNQSQTRGTSHCRLAVYIERDLKAKEEWWKLKYFTMQKYNVQKIL
jgi:hypothetical protein